MTFISTSMSNNIKRVQEEENIKSVCIEKIMISKDFTLDVLYGTMHLIASLLQFLSQFLQLFILYLNSD